MLTRRHFARSLLAAGGLSYLYWPFTSLAAEFPALTADRKRSLLAGLAREDRNYDPAAKMLRSRGTGGPGYHTTVKSGYVHSTRSSLTYAVALLDTGEDARLARAKEILQTVIGLQDQDPKSKTYGIWSWYLEEPLDKMSPPDWNWADFCGVQLLAAWLGHRDRLGATLAEEVRRSIEHAAHSIQRRNVGPGYTNIAIMGTYVTLVAAQEFELADLAEYASKRLRALHAYILEQGSFSEYNSPTYTIVALTELSRMLRDVRDGGSRRLIREIHDLAWKHAATHFHAPTRQWAGPQSRSYGQDLRKQPATLAFLEAATGGRSGLLKTDPLPLALDVCRLPLACPPELCAYYRELASPRSVVEVFVRAEANKSGRKNPITGSTWLHPRFTLGTVDRGDFWNQRRPLLAYWGTAEKPVCLRARFLHNHYDFCSALLFTAQHEDCALSTVLFATDYGDTHPSLDKVRNGAVQARDLRLRFELGAEIGQVKIFCPPVSTEPARITDGDLEVRLHRLRDSWDGQPARWETGRDNETVFIDAVLHSGEEKRFDFNACHEAFLAFALQIVPVNTGTFAPPPRLTRTGQQVASEWQLGSKLLRVEAKVKPQRLGIQNDTVGVTVL